MKLLGVFAPHKLSSESPGVKSGERASSTTAQTITGEITRDPSEGAPLVHSSSLQCVYA
jgi:hypothetical protein